jgi:hypothetical protein
VAESLFHARDVLQEIADERDASGGLLRERYARWVAVLEGVLGSLDDGDPTDVEAWHEVG